MLVKCFMFWFHISIMRYFLLAYKCSTRSEYYALRCKHLPMFHFLSRTLSNSANKWLNFNERMYIYIFENLYVKLIMYKNVARGNIREIGYLFKRNRSEAWDFSAKTTWVRQPRGKLWRCCVHILMENFKYNNRYNVPSAWTDWHTQ